MVGQRVKKRIVIIGLRLFAISALLYTATRIVIFAQLFGKFKDHSGIRLTQEEIFEAHNLSDIRTPVVPKIIHQVFHNWHDATDKPLPAKWESTRQSCIDLNPGWEYKLWTSQDSRTLIQLYFPSFLRTYDGYKYPIQRVDVVKYFALRKYGGIYIDLDNGCSANLEPLTYYPAFTIDGGQGALSNNIVGGQPHHPFFVLLTDNLGPWNWNYLLPYVTVMFASGQWYLTAIWEKYHSLLRDDGSVEGFKGDSWGILYRVLNDLRPGADRLIFFTQAVGESWADWDYRLLKTIGDYILLVVLSAWLAAGGVIWFYIRRKARRRPDFQYEPMMA
ncbi:hypothetical protein N7468_008218 [Penicillium chermesinum]|uniref:Mannosyl phosphorylinositol ceramide synthase SUR1 n=1 Tax=Penicillium chermesinum TaxID=63820 RepID=A0A9W9NPN2_9EURO|nr:uncharacterized protein N7468_008218 [Penicillium chermesinum]KAJ5223676.1 hypothetical protein N7468_008218 [Penicillium chermesinum]